MVKHPCTDAAGLRDYHPRVGIDRPRRRYAWIVLAFLVGLALGAQLHAAEPCVRLQLRPQVLLRRGDVDVQARVAPHADHRVLRVSWDSDAGAGGSRTFDLEGDRSPVLFQRWNQEQPAGHYVFEARVFDAGGRQIAVARQQIRSIEEGQ
jgi:hypothetical protein